MSFRESWTSRFLNGQGETHVVHYTSEYAFNKTVSSHSTYVIRGQITSYFLNNAKICFVNLLYQEEVYSQSGRLNNLEFKVIEEFKNGGILTHKA